MTQLDDTGVNMAQAELLQTKRKADQPSARSVGARHLRLTLPTLPFTIGLQRGSLYVAACFLALGLLVGFQSVRLDLGTVSAPGAGFVPFFMSIILICLALASLVSARQPVSDDVVVEFAHPRVVAVFVLLVVASLSFEPLGAMLTLGLLSAALLRLLAGLPVLLAAPAAAAGTGLAWFFFVHLLGLRLPTGMF